MNLRSGNAQKLRVRTSCHCRDNHRAASEQIDIAGVMLEDLERRARSRGLETGNGTAADYNDRPGEN